MTELELLEDKPKHGAMDIEALKKAFSCYATGVTVVCINGPDGHPRGFTANSFTSVALNPAMCLVCVGQQVRSFDHFREAKRFSVSVLGAEQELVSNTFAGDEDDRFAKVGWHPSDHGVPVIDGALSWFDCATAQHVIAGDHLILIGQIEAFGSREGDSLGYFRSGYRHIS